MKGFLSVLFIRSYAGIGGAMLGALTLGIVVSPTQADAEAVTVSVDVPVSEEPRAVTGIALGTSLHMIPSVSLKRFSTDTLTATFDVPEKTTAALAMAEMADGSTVFGDTRLVVDAKTLPSLASIPECPVVGVIKADASQRGLMESLVEIRTARRDVLKNRIEATLSGTTLEKAQKLEELFGLARPVKLSADLSPFEITDRVTRLTGAIKSYRITRATKRSDPPTATDSAADKK